MKRRRDLHTALEASLPALQLHLFTALKQKTQVAHACTSWVRGPRCCSGEGGDGCTGRHSQEVACPFYSNLCKCCALLFTPDLWLLCSGNVTAVINCQTSTILVLDALPNRTD